MKTLGVVALMALALATPTTGHELAAPPETQDTQKVVVHLSHFTDDLHAGFMALKVANAVQKRGGEVTLFLDLEGARLAHKHNDLAMRWGRSDTTLQQLYDQFVKAGGKAIVCPHCAHHAGIADESLRDGMVIATEEQIADAMLAASKVIDY